MICECLGYELSSVKSYQPLFKNALDDGHARKRLTLTPYKPSKRHCPDHSSSPLSEALTKLRGGWKLTCADHRGQRAQCQSSRGVNVTTEGSVLPEGMPGQLSRSLVVLYQLIFSAQDDDCELMSQCQSPCQSSRGDNAPTTDFPQSEDMTGQWPPVGPAKHSALSEDIASQPSAVLPITSSLTRPPGTADALSGFCPESNAGTASVTSLCSKTPEHTLGGSNDSESLHPTSIDSILSLQQETLSQPLPSEIPFNPREALYPASIDSLLSLQQETLNQPQPSEFAFNPREALHTSSTALFPRAVGRTPLPGQDATWQSHIMSDSSRTVKQPPPFFPNDLQLDYRQNTLSSVSPSSC